MLKKLGNGSYRVSSLSEAREAAKLLEERIEAVREIEEEMEKEYDLLTMRQEAVALKFAIEDFMVTKNRKKLELDGYRWQVIRPINRVWNADKLRNRLGKAKFLKICKVEPDPSKIDEYVKSGLIKLDDIEDALEEFPKKAYIKRYEDNEAAADEEAERVKAAMS